MWSNREEERRHRPSCADSDSALSSGEFARAVVCRVLRQQLCTCKTPDSTSACRSGSPSPPVGSYATPSSHRRSLFAGLLVFRIDLSIIDPTRRIGLTCNRTPPKRHWDSELRLPARRAFLASPWAKGSMSVCLGSSASGGPAPEAGTSLTAHASAHEPKEDFF